MLYPDIISRRFFKFTSVGAFAKNTGPSRPIWRFFTIPPSWSGRKNTFSILSSAASSAIPVIWDSLSLYPAITGICIQVLIFRATHLRFSRISLFPPPVASRWRAGFRRLISNKTKPARGTIFLDEIGELPLETQITLLRVLQPKEFERIGGSQTLRSDLRLVTSTDRDLESEVEAGRFRLDLF